MSFEPAITLVSEPIASKNSFKQIRLIICNIKLLEMWLLKIGPLLGIFFYFSEIFGPHHFSKGYIKTVKNDLSFLM